MNDLMSMGLHRLSNASRSPLAGVPTGVERVLDLAGGPAIWLGLLPQVGARGAGGVRASINAAMLGRGRERQVDAGHAGNLAYVQANAEALPLASGSVDCVTIGFGLRNVTDKPAALREMGRVLRPGGRALVLEFPARRR